MVMEPVNADEDALTVSVLACVGVTEAGFNEHVRPVVPAQVRFTLPEKPFNEVTVMVSVVELP